MSGKPKKRSSLGTIIELPSGRFKAFYKRNMKRHTPEQTFSTYRLADRWLLDEERLIERDEWTPPAQRRAEAKATEKADSITLESYAKTYIKERVTSDSKTLEPSTVTKYESYISLMGGLAEKPLNKITKADVEMWWNEFPAAATTRSKAYSFYKSVFAVAITNDLAAKMVFVKKNASRPPRVVPEKELGKRITSVDIPTMQAMINDYDTPVYRLAFELMAWCGFRTGETLALTAADITPVKGSDIELFKVDINKAVKIKNDMPYIGDPKNQWSYRLVAVPPHLNESIKKHLAGLKPTDFLFPPAGHKKPYAVSQHITGAKSTDRKGNPAPNRWVATTQKHGHAGFRVHDLRHWARMIWTRVETPHTNLQLLLGHRPTGIDSTYGSEDLKVLAEKAIEVSELSGWKRPPKKVRKINERMLANMTLEKLEEYLGSLTEEELEANAGVIARAFLEVKKHAQVNEQPDQQSREAN